ncbi:hypothetical protein ACRYCC_27550 [Actinomadura scrupuli]|uniref:hypothetical protein n=1 Tax=Actinomadura scrupuli TaxID=559629 RepID=UPI003D9522B0
MADMDHAATFRAVRTLINQHDPEGLLQVSAPEDEYDPEVEDLVALVQGDVEITSTSVSEIFNRWFGSSHWIANEQDDITEVAARLEEMRRLSTPR